MSALLSLEPALRRPLLDLVVRVARAESIIDPSQLAAVRGAQVALGLVESGLVASGLVASGLVASGLVASGVGDIALHPATGEWRALRDAPEAERSLAYALARWVALADGVLDDAEAALLASLRAELRLADPAVRLAESIANDVTLRVRRESLPAHRAFTLIALASARHAVRRRHLRAAA